MDFARWRLASLDGGAGATATARRTPLSALHTPREAQNQKCHLSAHGSAAWKDLFDYEPKLNELNDTPCPKEFIEGRRLPFIKGH